MTTGTRLRILAGNWKMNLDPREAVGYFEALQKNLAARTPERGVRRVIFPPAYDLGADVQRAAATCGVELGAQNVHWEEKGAFTGELAAPVLKALGVNWALVAHSERRQHFGETDQTAAARFARAAGVGLNVMFCIGETLAQREAGQTNEVLKRQLGPFLEVLTQLGRGNPAGGQTGSVAGSQTSVICLAYEPVWAIGTGKTATNAEAESAHRFIRQTIWDTLGMAAAQTMPILYGGSVTPDNVEGLLQQPNIDGALVGGASLKPDGFAKILGATGHFANF